jgi:hypothetical protein
LRDHAQTVRSGLFFYVLHASIDNPRTVSVQKSITVPDCFQNNFKLQFHQPDYNEFIKRLCMKGLSEVEKTWATGKTGDSQSFFAGN